MSLVWRYVYLWQHVTFLGIRDTIPFHRREDPHCPVCAVMAFVFTLLLVSLIGGTVSWLIA